LVSVTTASPPEPDGCSVKGGCRDADLEYMGVLRRVVGVLIGVALLAGAGTAWADNEPEVSGTTAASITASSALVSGSINANNHSTTYLFEYGLTTAYGSQTAQGSAGSDGSLHAVSASVTGLQASTTYHYRLVATSSKGTARGPDRSFTTLASGADPGTPSDPGTPTDPGGGPAAPTPELGLSVLIAPASGELRVRRPGTSGFVPLELGAELPMGTEVDARAGTLSLTAALPSGATQTGQFGGGRFKLSQDKRGYVDLYLRGRYCTPARGSAVASAAANKPSGRRLWGRDHGGRFRTHGRNSHATVRGTRWLVADTCKGTLTRVSRGSVVVRDTVRNKRFVLAAGERYLARPR
jgi:hypothetical protein